ncbi:prevent-host-death family protein [Streptomyces rimosus]|uniref:prevent-host-death family protein n=1 Tax=Streptomyces rimosus TaxID=1927 RepID=UPI0031D75D15
MDDIAPTAEAHARFEPQELADLEDALALAQYRARQASGETPAGIPHAEVRVRLGLERG